MCLRSKPPPNFKPADNAGSGAFRHCAADHGGPALEPKLECIFSGIGLWLAVVCRLRSCAQPNSPFPSLIPVGDPGLLEAKFGQCVRKTS